MRLGNPKIIYTGRDEYIFEGKTQKMEVERTELCEPNADDSNDVRR